LSLLATAADFEPANPTEGASALYYHPHDGSGCQHDHPRYTVRLDSLKTLYPPTGQATAIWGCGFGSLVDLADKAGYAATGFDASTYVINRGKALIPSAATSLFVRDALNATAVTNSKRDAGLKGAAKFALLVTEDLLTCMSDAEVTTTLPLLRGVATTLLHMVTPVDPWAQANSKNDPRINWKTMADWKTLIAGDSVYDLVANAVV
jgi:hypothetical protein